MNKLIDFSKGLVPVILQHAQTDSVLMLGYMNEEAYQKTLKEKKVTFFSRSKQRLWTKGETSGHFQHVESCLLYTSPSPRDRTRSRMPSSA